MLLSKQISCAFCWSGSAALSDTVATPLDCARNLGATVALIRTDALEVAPVEPVAPLGEAAAGEARDSAANIANAGMA